MIKKTIEVICDGCQTKLEFTQEVKTEKAAAEEIDKANWRRIKEYDICPSCVERATSGKQEASGKQAA